LGRAAGRPFTEYVQQRIFNALGMTSSGFELNAKMKANLAKGYRVQGETVSSEISDREHQGSGFRYPNGAVYTTMRDFARFASFELGLGPETVLKTDTLEKIYAEKPASGNGFDYGRGYKVIQRG